MNKDWVGGKKSVFSTLGASSHSEHDREQHDYYATEPKAAHLLMGVEKFSMNIWEPACGEGHLAREFEKAGYTVKSTDLIDRGYGEGGVDFFYQDDIFNGDIVTNPPYKYAADFVQKSLSLIPEGNKVAMFLKLTFLEGKERKKFFKENNPAVVYVSSSRIQCALNGKFEAYKSSAAAYAWFVWVKGYKGDTIVKWIN